jgi:transposase
VENELNLLSKSELIALLKEQSATAFKQLVEGESKVSALSLKNTEKDNQIAEQAHLIAQLRRMLFGSKKERFTQGDLAQLNLFVEEIIVDTFGDQPMVKELITFERDKTKKPHAGRNKIPENIPAFEVIIEPTESTEGMIKIGEERTDILEYIPASFIKIVLVRPKYARPNNQGVLIAELPARPIEKCLAGNRLLTILLIQKYIDHLPLYRQQQIFKRADIEIAPSTIDSWVAQLAKLLEPLYDKMVELVKAQKYLQADETTTSVLDKSKKDKAHRGFYWAYHAPLAKMIVFDYQRGRSAEAPRAFLEGYQGVLQTDGYQVYKQYYANDKVTHLACWAHARRYFEKALDSDKTRATHALLEIQKLYAVEREINDLDAEQKKTVRLEKSLPIINQLGGWLHDQRNLVLPKSHIGKAIAYVTPLWESLMNYLHNGDLFIDNNPIENAIRPIALGRKNYLFAGSHEGAQRSAMFYTFFGNCKMNNINPEKWLEYVITNIAELKVSQLHELFPQNLTNEKLDQIIRLQDM